MSGARVRLTDRCCLISTSSKSLTVLPSSTRPARWIVPVTASSASTRVVLPAPEWPTSTTLRTLSGASTTGGGPVTPLSWVFCAIGAPPASRGAAPGHVGRLLRPRCRSDTLSRAGHNPDARNPRASTGPVAAPGVTRRYRESAMAKILSVAGRVVAGRGHLIIGVVIATLSSFTDTIDGLMARRRGPSGRFGALLDSAMDRVSDGAIFASVGYWLATQHRSW